MRIFHYHLKKCGGTTMNAWLNTLSSAARAFNPDWNPGGAAYRYYPAPLAKPRPNTGRAVFCWSDVVHTHLPLRRHAPPGTFCFTFLRDPARRLVSQFTDWRRLTDADLERDDPQVRDCIASTRTLSLSDFLARHGEGFARFLFDNYMTRALAASRGGRHELGDTNVEDLLGEALEALHTDYHFAGLTEELDLSRNALCAHLGLPPAGTSPRLNRSAPEEDDPSLALTPEEVERFTRYDRVLYDAARQLFNARHRALATTYDTAAFEQNHAASLLAPLRAMHDGGAAKYSVREPFYGAGLHQRDGGYTARHAVWTRSGVRAQIYVPVPEGMRLNLLLWIRGYADPSQREALRVWVDGEEVRPDFTRQEGYEEVLSVPLLPLRSFARLELEAPHAALHPDDARPRGISFDAYGWRPSLS